MRKILLFVFIVILGVRFSGHAQTKEQRKPVQLTFEEEQAIKEKTIFPYLDAIRHQSERRASSGRYSGMLTELTISKTQSTPIQVKKGEQLVLEAYAHYENTRNKKLLKNLAIAVAAGVAASELNKAAQHGEENRKTSRSVGYVTGGAIAIPALIKYLKGKPQAMLMWQRFNNNRQLLEEGQTLVDNTAKSNWQLMKQVIHVSEDGYVIVHLVNKSKTPVWFDDVQLTETNDVPEQPSSETKPTQTNSEGKQPAKQNYVYSTMARTTDNQDAGCGDGDDDCDCEEEDCDNACDDDDDDSGTPTNGTPGTGSGGTGSSGTGGDGSTGSSGSTGGDGSGSGSNDFPFPTTDLPPVTVTDTPIDGGGGGVTIDLGGGGGSGGDTNIDGWGGNDGGTVGGDGGGYQDGGGIFPGNGGSSGNGNSGGGGNGGNTNDPGGNTSDLDCAGVQGGYAYFDDCGTCVGGTTEKVASLYFADEDSDGWGNSNKTKICYNPGAGWIRKPDDVNDKCFDLSNVPYQCYGSQQLKNISISTKLTPAEMDSLANVLQRLASTNCLTGQLIDNLTKNDLSVNWALNPSLSAGGYNPITNTISYHDMYITPQVLFHELFHKTQDNYYGNTMENILNSTDSKGFSNIEFEEKIMDDLVMGQITFFENPTVMSQYIDFLEDLQKNGPQANFDERFFYFIEYWKADNPRYNKPTDQELKPNFIKTWNLKCLN